MRFFFNRNNNTRRNPTPEEKALEELERKKNGGTDDQSAVLTDSDASHSISIVDEENHELLHEVMGDNLDLMLEIVMKVREDEEFAKTIYDDCPRLQALLDQHPDLRPIFEDPNLVRINFEQVYRNAGGVLPEDKQNIVYKKFKEYLPVIVNHPLFKIFRFVLLLRRIYNFIYGGGLAMMRAFSGSILALFGFDMINADRLLDHVGVPEDIHRESLYKAAEHMEDPAVQEQMKLLLEGNPDDLDEAIEQDPELRALREADPLCAELMNDPATLRILLDPDNLRALADCPDLIAADFEDPDWIPTEPTEEYQFDEEDLFEDEEDLLVDEEFEEPEQEFSATLLEGGSGIIEEFEQPEGASAANNNKDKGQQNQGNNGNGGGGVFSMVGTGLMGYIIAEMGLSPAGLLGGGGDEFGVESLVEQTGNAVEQSAQTATDAAVDQVERTADTTMTGLQTASDAVVEEAQRVAEDDTIMNTLQSTADQVAAAGEQNKENEANAALLYTTGIVATSAMGGMMMMGGGVKKQNQQSDNENAEDDDREEVDGETTDRKKSVRRFFRRRN